MRGAAPSSSSLPRNNCTATPSTSAPSSSIPARRRRSAAVAASSPRASSSSSSRRRSSPTLTVVAMATSAPSAASPKTLKTYDAASMSTQDLLAFTARPRVDFDSILATVGPIVDDVRKRGDAAVRELTAKFDKAELGKDSPPCVPIADLLPALERANLDKRVTDAFDVALSNIVRFHEAQRSADLTLETMPGVSCRRVTRPINRVGVYVPGGTAVLPSSALMLAAPARVAGCGTIVLATPPRPDGSVSPEVLYCAFKAGATHVLRAGGAQAVAALAFGTESTPKVDKILGPGNQFVTAAKMALQNSEAMVAIDMPAGPSEVLVIADAGAPPAHVAADLLSQAEHGPDSQVVLVALPGVDVAGVVAEVVRQAEALPRGATAFRALDHSCVVKVRSREEAAAFSNRYAPEHLIVNVDDAEAWLPLLDNAGSVFLGRWTPESVGDYASGTNHVLPTYGYARMYSGVSLDSFVKKMTVQSLSEEGLRNLGPSVATMARVEGLDAHERAVTLRLAALEEKK